MQQRPASEWSDAETSGKAFSLQDYRSKSPWITPNGNTSMLTKAELDHRSCPCCYRPQPRDGYCRRCVESGAALRHRSNPARLVPVQVPF